jgi:hypothetical protein
MNLRFEQDMQIGSVDISIDNNLIGKKSGKCRNQGRFTGPSFAAQDNHLEIRRYSI